MDDTQDISMHIKHFVLTDDGRIREYSSEEAFSVANGMTRIPELADLKVRYLQVRFDEESAEDDAMQIVTAGASIRFDADGRLCEADNLEIAEEPQEKAPITAFEQETCVQLALASVEFSPPLANQH